MLVPANANLTDAEAVLYGHINNGFEFVKNTEDQWVRLPSKEFLKRIFGNRYRAVVNSLIKQNLIEEDNSWLEGEFSKGYRPVPVTGKFVNRTCSGKVADRYREYKKEFAKKMEREIQSDLFSNSPEHLEAMRYDLNAMRIDADAAEKDSLAEYKKRKRPVVGETRERKEKREKKSDRYMHCCMAAISRVQNQQHWLTVCDFNRKHTSVTNCPKAVRKHITLWDRPIEWHDVSNCQPLIMLNLFLKMESWSEEEVENEVKTNLTLITKGKNKVKLTGEWNGELSKYHEFQKIRKMSHEEAEHRIREGINKLKQFVSKHREEIKEIFEEAQKGTYYEWISKKTGMTREESKASHMAMAYGRPTKTPQGMETIITACKLYKGAFHHVLPKRVTLIESEIFTEVSKKMWKRGIHHITAHDSIGTTEEHAKTVRELIAEEFKKETGTTPTIDKRRWEDRQEKETETATETETTGNKEHYVVHNASLEHLLTFSSQNDGIDRLLRLCRGPPELSGGIFF